MEINFRRNFFERYRISDDNVVKPQKFTDCAKIFNDCKDAEKYNNIEEDEEKDVKVEDGELDENLPENRTEAQEKIEQNSENDSPQRNAKIFIWQ